MDMKKYVRVCIWSSCLLLCLMILPFNLIRERNNTILPIPYDTYLKSEPHVAVKRTKRICTQKQRMKKAARKSSIKIKKKTKKSKVKKKNGTIVETVVVTTTKTIQKKNKKIKTIQITILTTVKTTTYSVVKNKSTPIKNTSKSFILKFSDIKGKVDPKVYSAFNDLGFSFMVDPNLAYTGVFSVRNHWIKIKTGNASYLYHELGHFVAALKNKADKTNEFQQIYEKERGKYTGNNKSYVTKDCSEYFAESFRDYTENAAKLKKERPSTFQYINQIVSSISDGDILRFKNAYGWYWRLY